MVGILKIKDQEKVRKKEKGMTVEKRELLCSECRKRVSYHIFKRPAKAIIKGFEIKYEEYYGICDECKNEIYVPGLDDQNEENIEKAYRKERNLITIPEIKSILHKYNIEKRPLSKLLGFGELTITRYIDGQLPSKRYSDILYEILQDEQKMRQYVEKNKDVVSSITINKVIHAIELCEEEKKTENSTERIALYIINSGRNITNLLLQKVLYYVKGISSLFDCGSIILEPCEAWKYGPVFPKIYEKYKDFGKNEISLNLTDEYINNLLTNDEKKITDYVLNTFGIYNVWFLKDLTHCEKPWIVARGGLDDIDASRNIMDDKIITEYFQKMNEKYNLKTSSGIDRYVRDMKKRMSLS